MKTTYLMVVTVIALFVIIAGTMLMKDTGPVFGPTPAQDKWEFGDFESQEKFEKEQEKEVEKPKVIKQVKAKNFAEAKMKSKELERPILIVFGATWCHWCDELKQKTLSNSKVKEMMKNYVFLYVDSDKDRKTVRKFKIRGLPSYIIADSRERDLKSGSGYKEADEFEKWLNNPELFKTK